MMALSMACLSLQPSTVPVHPTSFRRHPQGFRNAWHYAAFLSCYKSQRHGSPRPTSSQSVWVPGTGTVHLVKKKQFLVWPLGKNGEATNFDSASK